MVDVANKAGVALATVSRALNSPKLVSKETLKKVEDAVKHLRYVQDLTAGSLASSRSRIVGAIVPTLSNTWFAETMEGLASEIAPSGYQLMLAQSQYHAQSEFGLVNAFLGRRVDAMVLTGDIHEKAMTQQLKSLGLPIVETWSLPKRPLDMAVGFSNKAAGVLVGQYLKNKGRRRIAFLGADEHRSMLRLEGLQEGMQMPVVATQLVQPPSSMEAGIAGMEKLWNSLTQIDAIFCSNDILAAGALNYCRLNSINVPEKVAVVGFSDLAIAQTTWPSLTTVHVDAKEMGRIAGGMLLQRFNGQDPDQKTVDVGFKLIERYSS